MVNIVWRVDRRVVEEEARLRIWFCRNERWAVVRGSWDEVPPPWVAAPDLDPWLPATQGLPEWYIGLNWRPFWQTLTPDEKAEYLDRWDVPDEWRKVIADRYDEQDIDWEAEARAAAEWRANVVYPRPSRWWQWRRR